MKEVKDKRYLGIIKAFDPKTGKLFEIDLDLCVELKSEPKGEEEAWLRKQARAYGWWVSLREIAREAYKTAVERTDRLESELYVQFKSQMRTQGISESNIKDTELKHLVNSAANMQVSRNEMVQRETIHHRISGIIEVLQERRAHLQSMVKQAVGEMGSGLGDQ